jgi:hypothetical protein
MKQMAAEYPGINKYAAGKRPFFRELIITGIALFLKE